jgi:glycosyltransferase involved in cell wall biosynthesis
VNIVFLTSGHSPYDDRIYYHLGMTLSENGHKVMIISSKTEIIEGTEKISVNSFNGEKLTKKDKIIAFRERIEKFSPDIAICQEPLPVIAAKQYRRKNRRQLTIIYDITEWYPSARFLKEYSPALRWFGFLKLLLVNLYASYLADAFIFGERYKSRPYRLLFPFTPYKFITYYPDLKYISYKPSLFSDYKLRLSYSGEISFEKGFGNFMKIVNGLSDLNSDLEIEVKMVAWYESEKNREECEPLIRNHNKNVHVSVPGRQNFKDFAMQINDTDIFIDLRKTTFENKYSLPVKLFYYAALGRPVIISDLKAVRRDVEIKEFGFPVNPENTEVIINIITNYLKNPALYNNHCMNARRLAEEKYNWAKIAPEFLRFIESF